MALETEAEIQTEIDRVVGEIQTLSVATATDLKVGALSKSSSQNLGRLQTYLRFLFERLQSIPYEGTTEIAFDDTNDFDQDYDTGDDGI